LSSRGGDGPRRGDVWIVNLDPTVGAEIRKARPAVIVSSDGVGRLPIKLVAPITEWQASFEGTMWHVRLDPDSANGLTKVSAVDALQLRGVDVGRLTQRQGRLSATQMEEIAAAIALVVEYG
jgi:mRNA interferase MazF